MTGATINWEIIRLVVFDVDGTLYNQQAMRLRILRDLVGYSIASRSLETPMTLRLYRKLRETMGEHEVDGFDGELVARTAQEVGVEESKVQSIVREWIEQRPLAHIRACRYPNVVELFAALKRRNKIVGIFSDYPAAEKLRAMELSADIIVSAVDKNVGILKPHPRGLVVVMSAAGVGPEATILIGDRAERDGEAARRAGAASLIRSNRPIKGWSCFANYGDPHFSPLLNA
jgi:HAD superfamily hydrolase (TIGR01549 family)